MATSFISLLPKPPEENPAQAFQAGQLNQAKLTQAGAQTAAVQAETQKTGLENLQTQRDQQDQDILRKAMADSVNPSTGEPDMQKAKMLAIQNNLSPKGYMTWQKGEVEHQQALANLSGKHLENTKAQVDGVGGILQHLAGLPDADRINALPQAVAAAKQYGVDLPAEDKGANWYKSEAAFTIQSSQQLADKKAADENARAQAEEQRKAQLAPSQLTEAQNKAAESGITLQGSKLDLQAKNRSAAAVQLAGAATQQAYAQAYQSLDPSLKGQFPDPASWDPTKTPQAVIKGALTPEQQTTANQAATNAAETSRHNLSDESISKLKAGVEAGRLAMERTVNNMKFGPETAQYWAQQLADNPDSVSEMPKELATTAGKLFTAKTGLPLPKPLSGQTQQSETAARNALDGIAAIREDLQDAEVQKNLGPIMGRLGEAGQALGKQIGLSPAAEAKAQDLRTRMQYFVFSEGKAIMGGRMNGQLFKQLQDSSANVKMDAGTMTGALTGAEENAQQILDNADKQRFGGKMRPREMRGAGSTPAAAAGTVRVVSPEGKTGTIPADKLDEALKRGFKKVE